MEKEIEAILFYRNEPVSLKELAKILDKNPEEIKESIEVLKKNLNERGSGLALVENGENFSLATAPEVSRVIERMAKEELSKDLGKASLETLSIILYQGPVSRREIDYVRGVNSNFILRSLMMRGLVERTENKNSYTYQATIELLGHLGLKSRENLPEFEKIKEELAQINARE